MSRAIIDCRRHGKQRRFYVTREHTSDGNVPPTGMYLGVDGEGREAILGEPSSSLYKEVKSLIKE